MSLNLLGNIPGWGLIGLAVFIVVLYALLQFFHHNKKADVIITITNIVFLCALLLPILWFMDYHTAQTIIPINVTELFTVYQPVFIMLLCVLLGIPALFNALGGGAK